ncbi:hypothetical protein GCM10027160_06060 [Streptomyces calidiresistens]
MKNGPQTPKGYRKVAKQLPVRHPARPIIAPITSRQHRRDPPATPVQGGRITHPGGHSAPLRSGLAPKIIGPFGGG